jgi:DNA-binding GntR family transcriptional regulator
MSNASQRLRQEIENGIVTGGFPLGARLDEVSLAERFGVSRTPIREALQQLASAGLVEISPRRGAFVATPGPGRLFEMFEVMAELEAMCGRLAARRANGAAVADILAAHHACLDVVDDPDAYYERNERFHQTIYAASGNGFLAEQSLALQKRLRPYRRLQLRVGARTRKSFSEHEDIVQALQAHDPAAASDALRAHVTVQGERFADLVASLAQLKAA